MQVVSITPLEENECHRLAAFEKYRLAIKIERWKIALLLRDFAIGRNRFLKLRNSKGETVGRMPYDVHHFHWGTYKIRKAKRNAETY